MMVVVDVDADRLKKRFRSYETASNRPDSSSGDGGEPPWGSLERRVAKLEDDVGDIKQIVRDLAPKITEIHAAIQPMREDIGLLKSQYGDVVRDVAATRTDLSKEISDTRAELSKDIGEIRTVVAEIKGMVSKLPSVVTIIATVIGAIGVVFAGLAVLAYFAK